MSTALQYGTLAMLLFWPMVLMTSPMMLAAPGAANNTNTLGSIMLVLGYPVYIFLFYWLFGWTFFGWRGIEALLSASLIVIGSMLAFGYPQRFIRLRKGIANRGYSVAKGKAYFNGEPMDQADADTFTLLDNDRTAARDIDLALDRHYVFYRGDIVENADPGSFRFLEDKSSNYWADKNSVYYRSDRLPLIVPKGVEVSENPFGPAILFYHGKDDSGVYIRGKRLDGADPESFEILGPGLYKDKKHIFAPGKILPDANAARFIVLDEDGHYGSDGEKIYDLCGDQSSVVVNADAASFRLLDRAYACDNNHVFFRDVEGKTQVLAEAHTKSFCVTNYNPDTRSDAHDRRYLYMEGKIVGER